MPEKPAPQKRSTRPGDEYNLSGDFRGAVINIKSTIVSNAEVKDLENLPPEPGSPPFQGLQYFDEKDAERFFGRETLVARLVGRLTQTRFLAVIGASGSGKSSVVRAGVLPALRRGERLADGSLPPTDSGQWDLRVFTPSAHPLEALAASLTRESESVSAATALQADLAQTPKSLGLAARRLLAQDNRKQLLLVIDQFEEVFTQCRQEDERQALIDNLLTATDPTDPQPVTVLLTLRADFYAQLAQYDQLRERIAHNQEFIGVMSRAELTQAILKPAALGDWKVQEGLVEVILDDLGNEPGALPLLSHALLETWARRRGRVLTVSGYTASGGVHGAIAQTAETVFRQRLTPEQQPIARLIFIKLAEMGESALDTRRRATFSELLTRATDPVTIDAVLGILIDARLVTTGTLEPGEVRVVEVAHEALIREWPTLRNWLDQNRAGLILHRQLTEDTHDWLRLERDPGALYRGVRLRQTLEWARNNTDLISLDEQEFLDASREVARREGQQSQHLARARWIQLGLGSAATVLMLAMLVIALALNGVFAPRTMSGVYNIAVAEFGEMDANGVVQPSPAGKQLSDWTVNYLRDSLKGDTNLQVWPNEGNLFNRTHVALVQPQEAETAARQINASLLLYGYIDTRQTPPQFVLKFWVAPQFKYKFEDIQGSYSAGEPIRMADIHNPGLDVAGALGEQSSAIAWIGLGLAYEQLGQPAQALPAFLTADTANSDSELVQFFIGREYLFLADLQPAARETNLQAAESAFQRAIELNDEYARAYIGLGGVYFKRAAGLLDEAPTQQQPVGPDAMQWTDKALEAYQQVLELNPDPEQYGVPVADIARLALGNVYQLRGAIAATEKDPAAAQTALTQAIQTLEALRPAFESAVGEHESYRRYLAQLYEYLGAAYQWQGYAFELTQAYPQALAAYQKSLAAFDQCIAQGKASPDLILQNEIIGKRCQPAFQQTKQTYEALNGGQ